VIGGATSTEFVDACSVRSCDAAFVRSRDVGNVIGATRDGRAEARP
jgi:hypothetical protein